jgi:hypothetical protein
MVCTGEVVTTTRPSNTSFSPVSKKEVILQLLKRPTGVSLEKIIAATGWQAHSVRGFLSAAVGKQMGLEVASSKGEDGKRVYRIKS